MRPTPLVIAIQLPHQTAPFPSTVALNASLPH